MLICWNNRGKRTLWYSVQTGNLICSTISQYETRGVRKTTGDKGVGGRREIQEGGDICVPMADSS